MAAQFHVHCKADGATPEGHVLVGMSHADALKLLLDLAMIRAQATNIPVSIERNPTDNLMHELNHALFVSMQKREKNT